MSTKDQYRGPGARLRWRELLAGAVSLAVVISVWQFLRVHESTHAEMLCRMAASSLQANLQAELHGAALEESGLTPVWQLAEEPTREQWEASARAYLRQHPSAVALQWVDLQYRPVWMVSNGAALEPAAPARNDETRRAVLAQARELRRPILSRTLLTSDGTRLNYVAIAVTRGENLRGFMLATFRTHALLDSLLNEIAVPGYNVEIVEGADEIYRLPADGRRNIGQLVTTAGIQVPSVTWQLRVSPTPATVRATSSHLPLAFLVLGLVVSALLIISVHLAETARDQSLHAELATDEMKGSQSRLAGILDISPEAILSVDEQQRITLFNKGAEKTFGYASSEILGKPLSLLIPSRFRTAHEQHVQRFNGSAEPVMRMCDRRAVMGLRRDGTEFPAEASVSKLDIGGERIFTVIVRDITERVKAAQELYDAHEQLELRVKQRTAELAAANSTLRELSGRVLLSQDEERRRIARELHDSTAQNLLLLAVNLDELQKMSQNNPARHDDVLDQCVRLTEQTTSEIRTLSYLLHPPMLEEFGLGPALRWYLDGFAKRSGIATTIDLDPELGRLSDDVELTLFRVVQECLANIRRHSQSATAHVVLWRRGSEVSMSISDQGQGMPKEALAPSTERSTPLGVGIPGMRERLGHVGGRLDIQSGAEGTTVTAVIPLSDETDSSADVASA